MTMGRMLPQLAEHPPSVAARITAQNAGVQHGKQRLVLG